MIILRSFVNHTADLSLSDVADFAKSAQHPNTHVRIVPLAQDGGSCVVVIWTGDANTPDETLAALVRAELSR